VNGTAANVTSDANGNTLTDASGRTNTWDSQNRLRVCAANGTTSAFTYGSDGLRKRGIVTATDGGKTQTDYVYDGSMQVEEIVKYFSPTGAALDNPVTITYFQGPSGPLYRKASTEADPHWYVYDGLGSVVGEVGVVGNLTATKLVDVYGATRGGTS
jgi:hypothetical protein